MTRRGHGFKYDVTINFNVFQRGETWLVKNMIFDSKLLPMGLPDGRFRFNMYFTDGKDIQYALVQLYLGIRQKS